MIPYEVDRIAAAFGPPVEDSMVVANEKAGLQPRRKAECISEVLRT